MSEPASFWSFLKKHKGAFALFVAGAIGAFAWAVYVFWWFTGDAQSTGLVPSTLGLWSMGNLLNFIIYSIFWELVLVGIPVAAAAVGAWVWWRRLPYEERIGVFWGKRTRSARGGGGAGGLLFLAFAFKVYIDGNWNMHISDYSVNYVVGSCITILVWAAVTLGIPAAVALAWWIGRQTKNA